MSAEEIDGVSNDLTDLTKVVHKIIELMRERNLLTVEEMAQLLDFL